MAKTDAERQAAYRARLKVRASAQIEAMKEIERQAIFADWIDQLRDESPEAVALIRDFAARPARTGKAFKDWFVTMLNEDN